MFNFNPYIWQARILPGTIAIIPFIISINTIIFEKIFDFSSKWTIINAIIVGFGILIANWARDMGKSKEKSLWDKWGGPPTTRFLRQNNTEYNPYNRKRCYQFLKRRFSGIGIPTLEDELTNPKDADLRYESYVKNLITLTRDTKKYSLVFEENKNYGFWRNIYGLKWFGLISNIFFLAISIFLINYKNVGIFNYSNVYNLTAYINLAFICFWIFIVRECNIKRVAESYAERLLEVCFNYEMPKKYGDK